MKEEALLPFVDRCSIQIYRSSFGVVVDGHKICSMIGNILLKLRPVFNEKSPAIMIWSDDMKSGTHFEQQQLEIMSLFY